MTSYISAELRRLVFERAGHLCEYCLIHERDMYLGCQVDHVIAEKHGGLTIAENLCLACVYCNRGKGSDLGSTLTPTGELQLTRFFNPRADRWGQHFALVGIEIAPRTPIGAVTAKILGFNHHLRMQERELLQHIGHYPTLQARLLMAWPHREG